MNEWEILLNFLYCSGVGRAVCGIFVFCSVAMSVFYFSRKDKDKMSHADYVLVHTLVSIATAITLVGGFYLLFCKEVASSFVLDSNKNLVRVYHRQDWIALKPIKGEVEVFSYEKRNFVAYNGDYEVRVSFGGEFLPVYRAVKECGCVEHFIRSRIKQNAHFLTTGNDKLFSEFLKEDDITVLSIEKQDSIRLQKL